MSAHPEPAVRPSGSSRVRRQVGVALCHLGSRWLTSDSGVPSRNGELELGQELHDLRLQTRPITATVSIPGSGDGWARIDALRYLSDR